MQDIVIVPPIDRKIDVTNPVDLLLSTEVLDHIRLVCDSNHNVVGFHVFDLRDPANGDIHISAGGFPPAHWSHYCELELTSFDHTVNETVRRLFELLDVIDGVRTTPYMNFVQAPRPWPDLFTLYRRDGYDPE